MINFHVISPSRATTELSGKDLKMINFFELIEKIGKHFHGVMLEFREKSVIYLVKILTLVIRIVAKTKVYREKGVDLKFV